MRPDDRFPVNPTHAADRFSRRRPTAFLFRLPVLSHSHCCCCDSLTAHAPTDCPICAHLMAPYLFVSVLYVRQIGRVLEYCTVLYTTITVMCYCIILSTV